MCTAGPFLHCILRLQTVQPFRRDCRLQRCSTVNLLSPAPQLLCLTMLCSSLAGSHRESNQMLLVSAYASCLPSCLHMQLFSHLLRIASPPSRGLPLHLHIAFRPGRPCKAVAAIGAVLAPFERQRFSLVLFRTAYIFLRKMRKKMDPVRVPDSGPKIGPLSGPL